MNTQPRALRPKQKVTIASREAMLASLDDNGTVDGMPLMPQMLDLAGTEQHVYKRADKSCDTIDASGGRRLRGMVHLDGVRCDGRAYGGCQAGCLIFWSEQWLQASFVQAPSAEPSVSEQVVRDGTRQSSSAVGKTVYRCQATELVRASEPLAATDLRQYWRDWRANDVPIISLIRAFGFFLFRQSLRLGGYSVQTRLFNRWQKLWGRVPYPYRNGTLTSTPAQSLDLQPGELVRVKSHDEILSTVNQRNRNRGLYFDAEMVRYCGQVFQVDQRVTKIVHEKTGEMLEFGTPAIILKNVFCRSQVSRGRLFCPRSIHHYWREIWLERVDQPR